MTKQIKAMKILGLTDEEIADVLECDKRIDRGEKLFELDKDQKQTEKKMRQAERTKSPNYQFTKRERKTDNDKRFLMELIRQGLPDAANVEVTNPERELTFSYNGKKYKIVLSAPRS
jgi:FtsZ-interacting cell division protein YlmF